MQHLVDKRRDHDALLLCDAPDDEEIQEADDEDHSDEWFQKYGD